MLNIDIYKVKVFAGKKFEKFTHPELVLSSFTTITNSARCKKFFSVLKRFRVHSYIWNLFNTCYDDTWVQLSFTMENHQFHFSHTSVLTFEIPAHLIKFRCDWCIFVFFLFLPLCHYYVNMFYCILFYVCVKMKLYFLQLSKYRVIVDISYLFSNK